MHKCDKGKGREKRIRKLGGVWKSMTKERKELNQRKGTEKNEVGDFGSLGFPFKLLLVLGSFYFTLTVRGGGFSACPDTQR